MRKRQDRTLIIGVSSLSTMGRHFTRAWKQAKKGLPVDSTPHLYFENIGDFWKNLTPKRIELLYSLRKQGKLSIRKLAQSLKRDYKDVHSDVQTLLVVDLVQKDSEGLISTPWDSIVINLADSAIAQG